MKQLTYLTCQRSPEEESSQDIAACETSPVSGRTATIDSSEVWEFIQDCQGWNAIRFDIGRPVDVTMPTHRWQAWLSEYETTELAE